VLEQFLSVLRDSYDGTQIDSEMGTWSLSTEGPIQNWSLIGLSGLGIATLAGDGRSESSTSVVIMTKIGPLKRRMSFKLMIGGKPVSASYAQFWPTEDLRDSAVSYLDLMTQIFQIVDDTLAKHADIWFGKKPAHRLAKKQKPPMDLEAALASGSEDAIILAARSGNKLTTDQIIDIYNKAKELRSNKLTNFVRTLQTESTGADGVGRLLRS